MNIVRLVPSRMPWDRDAIGTSMLWVMERLRPAMKGGRWEALRLWADLETDRTWAYAVTGHGYSGIVAVCKSRQKGAINRFEFWVTYVAGNFRTGPKLTLLIMRAIMAAFERLARELKCSEIIIQGREWSRVLPTYEREELDNGMTRFRKVL